MTLFDLTKEAKPDLKSIARYTQDQWGLSQRNAYLKEVDQLFHTLAKSPAMGLACDDIVADYRKFPHVTHVIYYKQLAEGVLLIACILHGSMDLESHLGA